MSEVKLSPIELRKQQEGREKADKEKRRQQEAEADRQRREARDRAVQAQVDQVKATWYRNVVEATKNDEVRFLVLAQVVVEGRRNPPGVDDIIQALRTDGYECEVAHVELEYPAPYANRSRDNLESHEGRVRHGGHVLIGWKPAKVPSFGQSGSVQYLIVKW